MGWRLLAVVVVVLVGGGGGDGRVLLLVLVVAAAVHEVEVARVLAVRVVADPHADDAHSALHAHHAALRVPSACTRSGASSGSC